MTCPFCPAVPLLVFHRQGERTPRWRGCPCCGCIWAGRVEPANQVHPLAWLPACLHVPREVIA